jgi:hypothetical protein
MILLKIQVVKIVSVVVKVLFNNINLIRVIIFIKMVYRIQIIYLIAIVNRFY